jgi:hypothetical protein
VWWNDDGLWSTTLLDDASRHLILNLGLTDRRTEALVNDYGLKSKVFDLNVLVPKDGKSLDGLSPPSLAVLIQFLGHAHSHGYVAVLLPHSGLWGKPVSGCLDNPILLLPNIWSVESGSYLRGHETSAGPLLGAFLRMGMWMGIGMGMARVDAHLEQAGAWKNRKGDEILERWCEWWSDEDDNEGMKGTRNEEWKAREALHSNSPLHYSGKQAFDKHNRRQENETWTS